MAPMSDTARYAVFALHDELSSTSPVVPSIPTNNCQVHAMDAKESTRFTGVLKLNVVPNNCYKYRELQLNEICCLKPNGSFSTFRPPERRPYLKERLITNVGRVTIDESGQSGRSNGLRECSYEDVDENSNNNKEYHTNLERTRSCTSCKRKPIRTTEKRIHNNDSKKHSTERSFVKTSLASKNCLSTNNFSAPKRFVDVFDSTAGQSESSFKHGPTLISKRANDVEILITDRPITERSLIRPVVFENTEIEKLSNSKNMHYIYNTKTVCDQCVSNDSQIHEDHLQRHHNVKCLNRSSLISCTLPHPSVGENKSVNFVEQSSGGRTNTRVDTYRLPTHDSISSEATKLTIIASIARTTGVNKQTCIRMEATPQTPIAAQYRIRQGRVSPKVLRDDQDSPEVQGTDHCILAAQAGPFRISAVGYDCRYASGSCLTSFDSFSDDETRQIVEECRKRAVRKCQLWLKKYHINNRRT